MSETHASATEHGTALRVRRIALALDCSTLNRAAIETAVTLAAATHASLHAVFVENQCLFELAELPGARQVSGSGREVRAFDLGHVHADMARACAAARRAVSDAATRARVEWAFDTMRGLLDDALSAVGADAEIVALGSSQATIGRVHPIAGLRRMLRHGSGVIVAPARAPSPTGPVLAIVGEGADTARIVHTAESIAAHVGRGHRFVVVAGTAARRKELAAEVQELATRAAAVLTSEDDAFLSVAWRVRRERPGFVVADIDYACFSDATSVERIAESFGCPLLLVQV